VSPDALSLLVNRRLLRIEERLDIRRVELTHDVLCGVVKNSRQLRQEREARDASERQLAEQRERARTARQSLVRARKFAAFCSVLAIAALLAAAFAYISTQRAHRAELAADGSRRSAEQLLGYLTDDFSRELEAFGRIDVVAELSRRQVDYFNALPEALKGPDTRRNGALAMFHHAAASRRMGKLDAAEKSSAEAVRLLTGLRDAGDHSEGTAIALALAKDTQASTFFDLGRPNTVPMVQEAIQLLKPFAESSNASLAARRAYVDVLNDLGYQQMRQQKYDEAVATLYVGLRIAAGAGARDLKFPDISGQYAYIGGWLIEALGYLDRHEEARTVAAQTGEVADRLVEQRPGDLLALKAQQLIASNIGFINLNDMRDAEAIADARTALAASGSIMRFDPGNEIAQFNLAVDKWLLSDAQWAMGQPADAVDSMRDVLKIFSGHLYGPLTISFFLFQSNVASLRMAEVGDIAGTAPVIAEAERQADALKAGASAGDPRVELGHCRAEDNRIVVALRSGAPETARALAGKCVQRLPTLQPRDANEERLLNLAEFIKGDEIGLAEYMLGNYAAAERSLRDALAARDRAPVLGNLDRRERAQTAVLLAVSLARQGKSSEAREVIEPVVRLYRSFAAQNKDDQRLRVEQAAALCAQALADASSRGKLLAEARTLVESLPPQMRGLWEVATWRDRIAAAARGGT
jgi:tetratricopeptide (TPR) repeat protein